jgi:hypothetical protein
MTDNGLAALAAALETVLLRWNRDCEGPEGWRRFSGDYAAAILAALPPDWCGHTKELFWKQADMEADRDNENATLRADLAHCERAWEDAGTEIATLRAALDGLVVAAGNLSDRRTLDSDGFWVSKKEMRALDAALATAKETP